MIRFWVGLEEKLVWRKRKTNHEKHMHVFFMIPRGLPRPRGRPAAACRLPTTRPAASPSPSRGAGLGCGRKGAEVHQRIDQAMGAGGRGGRARGNRQARARQETRGPKGDDIAQTLEGPGGYNRSYIKDPICPETLPRRRPDPGRKKGAYKN